MEALEDALALVRPATPGPSSSTSRRARAVHRASTRTATRPPAVAARVLDEVRRARAPSASRSPRTVTGDRRRRRRRRRASRASSSSANLVVGQRPPPPRARARAGRRRAARAASASACEVGDQLRRRAVTGEVLDVAAQRGERRAQLVRRVGDEAPLRLARALERVEHRVQRRGEAADLVARGAARAAGVRASPVRPISAAARSSRTSGRSARPIRNQTADAPIERRAERAEERHELAPRAIVSSTSAVDAATTTAPPAAGPTSSRAARRRRAGRSPPSSASRSRPRPAIAGAASDAVEHAAAERERAGDDAARAGRRPRPSPASRRPASRARPGVVSSAGAEAASCATSTARARSVWSSARCRWRATSTSTAEPSTATAISVASADGEDEAKPRCSSRARSRRRGSSRCIAGVAELPPQVRDVAVDDVRALPRRPRSAAIACSRVTTRRALRSSSSSSAASRPLSGRMRRRRAVTSRVARSNERSPKREQSPRAAARGEAARGPGRAARRSRTA